MRWKFCEPNDAEEVHRQAILERIDAWWSAFAEKEESIRALFKQEVDWDLADWMHENLNAIDASLMWEFGPSVIGDGHRLVITPETERHLRPLVCVILNRAPKLVGWDFFPYRLPESVEQAALAVKGRTGGSLDDLTVRVSAGEYNRIDLTYFSPRCTGLDNQRVLNDAFVATEELVGEELLDKWIGVIEAQPLPKGGHLSSVLGRKETGSRIPIARLLPTVQAVIGSIRDQLHRHPLHGIDLQADDHAWSAIERQPEEREDYPDRSDLFVMISGLPAMSLAAQNDNAFCCERFSRFSEVFCYLKIDSIEGLPGFENREQLEDAIDHVLVPAKAGRTVAGGSGLRYLYVDLALTDVRSAINLLCPALDGKVPKRSWFLFFEREMADEWVGISIDSPPPPRATP